jgi:hypothetical protein
MKMFLFAAVAAVSLASFVLGEEITGNITKSDAKAGTITFSKFGKKGEDAPAAMTATLAKDCKIAKGEFDMAGGKGGGGKGGGGKGFAVKAGDKIDKGLADDAFTKPANEKGVMARITIADEDKGAVKKGQVTEILVIEFKGFKKGGG